MKETIFKAKVAFIQLKTAGMSRLIENPSVKEFDSQKYIEGLICSPDPDHFDHGKRIVIPLSEIVTFTELNSVQDVYKGRNLKLLKGEK